MARAHPAQLQTDPHADHLAAPQGALLADHHGYLPPSLAHTAAHATAHATHGDAGEFGYGENFMAPLSPRAVARWVARHGRALLDTPNDGPVRRVSGAVMPGGAQHGAVYVLTAAIDGGALRSRVLVGSGSKAAVLGPRLWSQPRLALAAMAAASLLMGAGLGLSTLLQPAVSPSVLQAQAASAASAASAAAAALAASASAAPSASASVAASASAPASAAAAAAAAESAASAPAATPAASAPAASEASGAAAAGAESAAAAAATTANGAPPIAPESAAPSAADPHKPATATRLPAAQAPTAELAISTTRPTPAYARKGVLALPSRGPGLSDEDKEAARQAVADARAALSSRSARSALGRQAEAAAAAAESAPGAQGAAAETRQARPRAGAAAPATVAPTGPVYAVSTRPLRTRAEAEQLLAAMGALLRTTGAIGVKLELLPEGEDWRVVAWPFSNQADADRARAMLVGRGMRVQVLRF
jgi:hypothetical protein